MGEAMPPALRLPPDEEIAARLRARDDSMFARVVDAWSPGMLRTAQAYVSTRESAEDVVQDTWMAVIRGIDRFAARSALRTWVYRILVNTAKTRGVREHRMSTLPATDGDGGPTVDPGRFRGPDDPYPGHWIEPPPPWPLSVEDQIVSREVRHEVAAAIAGLPQRQRVVITLRDVEGYTSEEVCALVEISAANQRVLLHRARAAVRCGLETYFGTADSPTQKEAR